MAVLAVLSLGCTRAPVYNVVDAPVGPALSVQQVGERIERAARFQGWEIEEVRAGLIYARKHHVAHAATAEIRYDGDSFSIRLRGSENFKQGGGRIHKLYNLWVRDLESGIRRELAERD